MFASFRFVLPATLFFVIVGGFLAWQTPHIGAATGDDDLITASPFPTASPTPSPTPSITPTPTPTATPPGPACPAGTLPPPSAGCAPCPTFGFQANDVGVYSTCAPSPTPWVSPTPCPPVSPTNCDVVPPKAGDANCDYAVDEDDALVVLGDVAGGEPAQCRIYANVKCSDPLDVVDALFILQFKAGITPQIPAWCPTVGAQL